MGFQELGHVKGRVIADIAVFLANRASDARQATAPPTGVVLGVKMAETGLEVVASFRERANRTGGQTRAILAVVARAPPNRFRLVERMIDQESGAKSEPEAVDRMNGQSDRRWEEGAGTLGPTHEGVVGRPLERIEGDDAKIPGDIVDNLAGPLIEAEVRAISSRALKKRPDQRRDIADNGQGMRLINLVGQHALGIAQLKGAKHFQTIGL